MKTGCAVCILMIACAGCGGSADTFEQISIEQTKAPVSDHGAAAEALADDETRQQQLDALEDRLDDIVDELEYNDEELDREKILEQLRSELPPGMDEVPQEIIEELDWWLE